MSYLELSNGTGTVLHREKSSDVDCRSQGNHDKSPKHSQVGSEGLEAEEQDTEAEEKVEKRQHGRTQ